MAPFSPMPLAPLGAIGVGMPSVSVTNEGSSAAEGNR